MGSFHSFILSIFFKKCPSTGRIVSIRWRNAVSMVLFPITGLLALLWYMVRVLPKPSRAAYPCQRVAAPVASTFVTWLIAITVSSIAFRKARTAFKRSRYVVAGVCASAAVVAIYLCSIKTADPAGAQTSYALQPLPAPIGVARGTVPGRVVWAWDPAATNENCTNVYPDYYFLDVNTNPVVVEQMFSKSIQQLTNTTTDTAAWDSIFTYYNASKRGLANTGYQAGEKIFIKLNLCSGYGMAKADGYTKLPNYSYPDAYPCDMRGMPDVSPQMVRTMLKELTTVAGVPQENIYIGDPNRPFFDQLFNAIQPSYPNVHYVDRWGTSGREKSTPTDQPVIFYSDHFGGTSGTYDPAISDSLPQQIYNAAYLINMAVLKCHESAGITLCGKNHSGSPSRTTVANPDQGSAWAFHHSLPDYNNPGYNKYRNIVDFMGHKDLGGKTILCVVDGLWGGHNSTPNTPNRWKSQPFNNDWPSSILMSQDIVAIDAVGFDFLRTEYSTDYGYGGGYQWPNVTNGVDDYLFQAASSAYWPATDANGQPFAGYDPENDGTVIGSLGVYEHWNNATDKQYTKNVNPAAPNGIELVKILAPQQPQPPLTKLTISTAAASSAMQAATLAIDGNTGTRWESTHGVDPQWIVFDLGVAQSASVMVIDWESANAKNYTIEGSNDATFATKTTLVTRTNMAAGQHRIDSLTGLTGSYRYYRMYGTARNLTYGYSIWETRFYSGNAVPVTYSITASAGPNGTISPSGTIIVNQGANQTFSMAPNSGYVVDVVTVDGVSMGAAASYTFTNVTASHSINVTFKPTPVYYALATAVSPTAGGTVSGGGSYGSGATATVTATPATGYTFTSWSGDITGTANPATVTMNAAKSVTANFTLKTFTITASAGANGAISPNGAIPVNYGSTQTFTITPGSGYVIDVVTVDGAGVGAVTAYTFTNVTAAHTIAAAFKVPGATLIKETVAASAASSAIQASTLAHDGNTGTRWESTHGVDPQWIRYDIGSAKSIVVLVIDWEAANAKNYTIEGSNDATFATKTTLVTKTNMPAGQHRIDSLFGLTGTYRYYRIYGTARNLTYGYSIWETRFYSSSVPPVMYTITASAGANGTISPGGTVSVSSGAGQTFTITPNSGYAVDAVTVDGAGVGSVSGYSFTNVIANHTISATFKQAYTLTTTVNPAGGGTVSGSGSYASGATATVTATPATGYIFTSWSGDITGTANPATVTMDASKSVTANFTVRTYTITASADANGAISPNGAVPVNYGSTQSFTMTPNSGYVVDAVTVDGASVGAVLSYSFSNVNANHTISATFISPATNGSLSDVNIKYFGRWDKSNTTIYHGYWGGAYLKVLFTGTTVKINLGNTLKYYAKIDDNPWVTFTAVNGITNLTTTPLTQGTHTLVVAQGQDVLYDFAFKGLSLDPGANTLPPTVGTDLIEWIGNSITDGYLNTRSDVSAYAWVCAETLGCEHTQIAYVGIALVDGYGQQHTTGMATQYFKLQDISYGTSVNWDFSQYTPKVVVIDIGTNDGQTGTPTATYQSTYITFLGNIRAKFPDAHIVVMVPYGGYMRAQDSLAYQARLAAGDSKIHYINTTGWLQSSDLQPDGIHPTDNGHIKLAGLLASFIHPYLTPNNKIDPPTSLAVGSITSTGATFSWIGSSGATSYNIQVSPNSSFSPLTVDATGITGTSYSTTALTAGTTYYWHVNAMSSDGLSSWALPSPATFTTPVPVNYTLTVSSVNGTVGLSPAGPSYTEGTVVTLTATPGVGYAFDSWTGAISGAANPATITMDADKSVTANFASVGTYVVQASSDVNGTINPSGTVPTTLGTARTFTMTPNSGYAVNQVTVDGASAGAVTTYTFPSTTTGTHSISVTFKASAPVKLPISSATASSTENAGTPASAAIDNNTGTRWSSAFSDPQWIVADLGAAKTISRVRLLWETASAKNYVIEGSNDATFATKTTLVTKTAMAAGARTDDLTGLSGSYRYVRMYGTVRNTAWGYSLWEFEVYGN